MYTVVTHCCQAPQIQLYSTQKFLITTHNINSRAWHCTYDLLNSLAKQQTFLSSLINTTSVRLDALRPNVQSTASSKACPGCTSDNSIGQNKRHSRYGMSRRQQHYCSTFLCLANCRDQLMNGLVCTHAEIVPLSVQNLYSFDCISSPPSSFCVVTSVFSNSQTYLPTYQGHAFFPSTNTAA